MGEHTPGPWFANEVKATGDWTIRQGVLDSEQGPVGSMGAIARMFKTDRHGNAVEANARLIAAAPDLLEALEYLIDARNPFDWAIAAQAIAKAKGAANGGSTNG